MENMKFWDCHVHSALSFDSTEPMENYVKKAAQAGDEYFITTEHADLESHILDGGDILADLDRQRRLIEKLSAEYPVKVLYGIEAGWRRDIHHRIKAIVESRPFDMVILSIHETEYADVSYPDYMRGRTVDQCYEEYLALAAEAIESFDNFDTFAHLDYLLRYIGDTDLSRHTESLSRIFRLLIEKGKAVEINTKMFPQPESVRRAEELLALYVSLGGRRITIGSDAHTADRHRNGFDTVIALLKKYNIDRVSVYIGRKEYKVPLPE